jgi:hypothetical protein
MKNVLDKTLIVPIREYNKLSLLKAILLSHENGDSSKLKIYLTNRLFINLIKITVGLTVLVAVVTNVVKYS